MLMGRAKATGVLRTPSVGATKEAEARDNEERWFPIDQDDSDSIRLLQLLLVVVVQAKAGREKRNIIIGRIIRAHQNDRVTRGGV